MASDAAELSSIAGALDDLERRLAGIAEHYRGTERDDLLGALYEAERTLRATLRQVERARELAD
jgi:hypothetical protein